MVNKKRQKILIIVEGEKTEAALMHKLFSIYKIDSEYELVSYKANIYSLYNQMFKNHNPQDFELQQILKEREQDVYKNEILDATYSDILLIFDFDPQAPEFSPEKVEEIAQYFKESSDMGKLYINYPMVESFYHMKDIPDLNYNTYYTTMIELLKKAYKTRVNRENRNHDYSKFATTKHECTTVIQQNLDKAWLLLNETPCDTLPPEQIKIVTAQLKHLTESKKIAVLCTCAFFIPEYNPKLLEEKEHSN